LVPKDLKKEVAYGESITYNKWSRGR